MVRSCDSKGRRGPGSRKHRVGAGHARDTLARLTLEFSRVIPSVSEESAVGKIGGKRCHSAKKAVFAGMVRSCDSKGRRGPCPRHGTSDFDGALWLDPGR
jgi:hypothetical protein